MITKGIHLVSAILPWAMALVVFLPHPESLWAHIGHAITKRVKAPKWYWLILTPISAFIVV